MKLISVYVTVGAISFAKCEVNYNSVIPLRSWHRNQIYPGELNTRKYETKSGTEPNENSGIETKSQVGLEEPDERKRDFSQVFSRMKNIYEECKNKVNKTLNKLIKAKVKSRLFELRAYLRFMYQCIKVFSFRLLDEISQGDVIRITDFAYFVRDGANANATRGLSSARTSQAGPLFPLGDYETRILGRKWTALLRDWLESLLQTHSLKFRLGKTLIAQGRGRRRDHRMFAMMVMGFMIMASILIPMGFQFLTVLGGKSLLLAKMALIMSAINGLKKIATSNVGYGFYHTGSDAHHHDHLHHGFHEKHFHLTPPNHSSFQGYN